MPDAIGMLIAGIVLGFGLGGVLVAVLNFLDRRKK